MELYSQNKNNLLKDIIDNDKLSKEEKTQLLANLDSISRPLESDPWIYRIVVLALGLTVVGTVVGGFYLAANTAASIPEGLIALGSAAVGALAGLLAPSPSRQGK